MLLTVSLWNLTSRIVRLRIKSKSIGCSAFMSRAWDVHERTSISRAEASEWRRAVKGIAAKGQKQMK